MGVIEGILFSSQKREYPLTSTNFKPKLHLNASLLAKCILNLSRFIKALKKALVLSFAVVVVDSADFDNICIF